MTVRIARIIEAAASMPDTQFEVPAYGRGIAGRIEKLLLERDGDLLMLLPARTDTRWWKRATEGALWCGIEGRVRFDGHSGGAPFPSAVVYRGAHPERFVAALQAFGIVYRCHP